MQEKDLGTLVAEKMRADMSPEFLVYCARELIDPKPIYWQMWKASRETRLAEEENIDSFFERYNSAINNPAPEDDGGTTAYEYERLLDEAVELLEKLA